MTNLSGAGARVLLIATAAHHGPTLSSVPSVARTYQDLQKVLIERCGVRTDQLHAMLDPPDAQTMALAVAEEAQRADTVLLVYFIGHGLLGPGGELYLAASGTDRLTPGLAEHQALSFSSLRQALGASRASSIVVVLDCCFSGRVSLGATASIPQFVLEPAHGLYLIGSAEQLALAPPDAAHTAFTGELIELLTRGDPRGQHLLTLDAVYDAVFRSMRDQQRPLPRRQAGDRAGNLVIAPNPALPAQAQPSEEPEAAPGRCPYPGLDAFGVDDAELFFGRERMTGRVLIAVEASADDSGKPGPLVLVGPSGSGKTSLLNAGLLARLRDGSLPGSVSWLCVRLTPGLSPLQRLASHFNAATPDTAELLREDPSHAVKLVDQLLADRPGQRLILLVDQLEELFALCPDQSERAAFLRAVTAIASPVGDDPPRGLVVFALRADFYGQAAAYPELLAALRDRQLLVEPMTPDEFRAAIEQPAAAAGLALDDGLADVILHELGATPQSPQPATGALPLLSHVLWATWRQRAGSRLTVAGYRAAGGISQAIATTAEQVYTALDPAGQDAARRMLPRLVRVGEDAADTARPVERSTLVHGVPDPHAAKRAIDRFTEARLLTLDRDTARISHETLLRAWPRLREWIDADRDWLRVHQQLADDAEAWERTGCDPSLLYRGNRLAALRERAAEAPAGAADLEPTLAGFMDTSWRHERRGIRRRRRAVAFLATLTLLAAVGLTGSIVFQQQAAQAQERDVARYLAAEAEDLRDRQPGLAKQLSLLSYRIDPEAGRGAVFNSQRTPGVINDGEPAYDIAPSADGRVLAISTGDAIVLRAQGGSGRVSELLAGPIAVTSDGGLLAAATYDNPQSSSATVRLWDITDVAHPKQIAAPRVDPAVTALAVTADDTTLYGGAATGEIFPWDISDPAAPKALPTLRAHSAQVDSLAVSPQRNLLASASIDGRAQLWDIADAEHPVPITTFDVPTYRYGSLSDQQPVHRVAFDPSGLLLATPGATETDSGEVLHLWNLDDPHAPRRVESDNEDTGIGVHSCTSSIVSLAFSPANKQIVGGCGGWQVWMYETAPDPEKIVSGASISDYGSRTGSILFDPGNAHRMLRATDRGVQVLDLSNPARPGATTFLPVPFSSDTQVAFRPAGQRRLLTAQTVGSNALWDVTDVANPKLVSTTSVPAALENQEIALSPDGGLVAVTEPYFPNNSVGLRLRSAADPGGQPLSTIDVDNGVGTMAFSPTKPILAVSVVNTWLPEKHTPPTIRLYDIADPRQPRQIAQIPAQSWSFAFSPDGETLTASIPPDKQPDELRLTPGVQLRGWDISDPARPTELWTRRLPPGEEFASFAYRPDGALLAVYATGGTLRLWHVDRQRLSGDPVSVAVGFSGSSMAFSPDGTRLALNSTPADPTSEHRPEIWDLTNPDAPYRESYLPGDDSLSYPSFAFSPDGGVLAVARNESGVELWDTDPDSIVTNLCNAAGDPITPQQWEHYLPDRTYQPPCQ